MTVQRNPFFVVITMLFTVASTMAVTAPDAAAVDPVAPSYTFTSIPYPGSSVAWSFGINNYFSTVGEAYVPDGINTYVRYGDGTFSQIASEGGSVAAYGINNLGQIVGANGNTSTGFLIDKGGTFASASVLAYPNAFFTTANAINDTGVVVGNFCLTENSGCSAYFRDQNGNYFELTYPGSTVTQAYGVNDWDEIVGNYNVGTGVGPTGIPYNYGYLRCPGGGFVSIVYPGAAQTLPTGINNHGSIVGVYWSPSLGSHGFLRHREGTFDTVDYPGSTTTWPWAINDAGAISGYYTGPKTSNDAFLALRTDTAASETNIEDETGQHACRF